MTNKIFAAIDPGANGAAVVRFPDGRIEITKYSETDAVAVVDGLRELKSAGNEVEVWLEDVGGFVGKAQPGSAMFRFGANYGFWRGLVQGAKLRLELVRPQKWQSGIKDLKRGTGKADHKRALRDAAARLYPDIKVTLANADALLILDYAIKQSFNHGSI